MPIERKLTAAFPTFPSVRDEAKKPGLNLVLFGPPGVGKTTLLAGIKEVNPEEGVLLFDTDIGRESVSDMDIDFVEPPKYLEALSKSESTEGISKKLTWDELRSYLDTAIALRDTSPYKTLIFDSLSSIYYELLIPKVVGNETRKVEWPHYAEAQRLLTKLIRDAKSLSEYGINTFFTGHVKEETDGDIVNIRLALPQGVRNEVLLTVNHVGYLTRGKRDLSTRELYLEPPKKVDGPKYRIPKSGEAPPSVITNPTMHEVLKFLS